MKNIASLLSLAVLLLACSPEQFKRTMDNLEGVVGAPSGLTTTEVVSGLKEALVVGTGNAVEKSSAIDGFFKNPRIFIPFPEEADKVRRTALNLGLRSQVELFEQTLNRAAEESAKKAVPIFVDAITAMTINDAFSILRGENNAATNYLRSRTEIELEALFNPVVQEAIAKVELTRYWNPLAKAYNTAATFTGDEPVNPDLEAYVTSKTINGLFILIADEEEMIRENPSARISDLLKKVFAAQD